MQMISYKDLVVYGDDTYRNILSATENYDDVLQFIPKNASRPSLILHKLVCHIQDYLRMNQGMIFSADSLKLPFSITECVNHGFLVWPDKL